MNPHPVSAPLSSRRNFLLNAGAGIAVAALGAPGTVAGAEKSASAPAAVPPGPARPRSGFPIAGLEKHFFEKYTPEQTAQVYDEMGIDIELTLRPEGHIKPEHAASELPRMAAAFAKRNRRVLILASSFVRPDEPHIESSLRAAKKLGIELYRHRGFKYRPGTPLKEQIAGFRSMARDFAAMNREIGVQALYQNHAGADFVGAAIWDLDQVLDDIDPKLFGVALDCRHLLVEQGRAWPTALRLIAPRVASLFVKSFRWERDRTVETPLREGIVTPQMVNAVVGDRTSLPVCLHVEYPPHQAVPFADRARIAGMFRDDANLLRSWLRIA